MSEPTHVLICRQAVKCVVCDFAILPGQAMVLTSWGWTHATEVDES